MILKVESVGVVGRHRLLEKPSELCQRYLEVYLTHSQISGT